ncbi:AAA family ATPase [Palaeococcus ferrophilus]|uniref:AAA family ATPase n=1 Tax=Palaeococcus ferrophilus TaxID=83868 RepID=UPI00064EE119|nr:AAA family ATPase [Palaeococcus ferrophilus]
MIIYVVGMPGSGKGEVVKVFRRLGVPHVSMGDVVREEAEKRGVLKTPEGMRKVSIQLRQEFGESAVAKLCIPKVRKLLAEHDTVVVDGVRSLDEIGTFREAFPEEKMVVIAVHSSPHKRFERLRRRGRSDDPSTWGDFEERDWKELRFGLGNVIALADYMLVNDDGLDEYRMRILQLAKKLGVLDLPQHGIKEEHHVEADEKAESY